MAILLPQKTHKKDILVKAYLYVLGVQILIHLASFFPWELLLGPLHRDFGLSEKVKQVLSGRLIQWEGVEYKKRV